MITLQDIIQAEKFSNIQPKNEPTIKTGIKILDDWFSNKGGMVIGSAIFLTGTSGAGKTTLMAFFAKMLNNLTYSIYSREMPKHALKEQVDRLNINNDNLYISDAETRPTFDSFVEALNEIKPRIVVMDSIQVVAKEDFPNMSEADAIYHIIKTLRDWTDKNNAVLFVIGHVTKEGVFRGDNTIMQMFDAHMEMIFDKKTNSRTLSWGQKNRKGPMGEPLYYDFTNDDILFFTEMEWNMRGMDVCLYEFVQNSIFTFLESINKQHPNYRAFSDEIKREIKTLASKMNDPMYFTIEFMKAAQNLLERHGFVK